MIKPAGCTICIHFHSKGLFDVSNNGGDQGGDVKFNKKINSTKKKKILIGFHLTDLC